MDPSRFLIPVLVPAVVFGLTTLALARPFGDGPKSQKVSGVALFLTYLTGHWLVVGPPSLVPRRYVEWLPYFALVGLGLGFLEPGRLKLTGCIVASVVLPWVLLASKISRWGAGEAIVWLALCFVFLSSALLAWDELAARLGTRWWGIVSMLLAASLAIILPVSGNLQLGQLAGVLAAGSGALVTVNWIWPRAEGARRFLPVFVCVGFGVLAAGHVDFYGYMHRDVTALVWLAPLLVFAVPRSSKPWVGVVLVTVALAVATAIAFGGAPPLGPYDEYR